MNRLRRASVVAILTLALAVSALAGTIDSPGIAAPPPPPPPSQTSSSITTTVILTILSLIR